MVQGLGLWPAPEGHEVEGDQRVIDSPQAVSKGALRGLGLRPAHSGCTRAPHGAQHQGAPGWAGQASAREPKGAQQFMWGAGDHNHPLPPPGQRRRQQCAPSGNVGVTPPMAAGTEGDRNFPLPQPEEKEVVQGRPQRGKGRWGTTITPSPRRVRIVPPLLQMGEKEVVQGLGLWPAPEGHGVMGGHGVTDSPRAGYKGALQGLGLWLAQGGGEKWQGATSSSTPLTGASSGAPGNPAWRGRAPRRRLHGRASSEVT